MCSLQKLLFVCVIMLLTVQIYAQSAEVPTFTSNILESPPKLDGDILNDAVWATVPALKELKQIQPTYGAPASQKTDIRVAFSGATLYVGVVCYVDNPKNIVVSDSRRDADLSDDDSFLFIIDTYNDLQNGFLFGTNASGMEYDAQIDNEGKGNSSTSRQQGGVVGGTNINWDASWDVKTQVGDYGWSAEFAIPLKSIRYAVGENKTWGINFQRNISKTTETAYWAELPLGFNIKRLSLAGKMTNLNLSKSGNLKLIPYTLGQLINNQAVSPADTDTNFDFGIDTKFSITPSLTLDATYNTDFAQVEVDEQQVNLDRFNLFFPEKRAFFLENAGQFTVGSPGEIDLFFSRRIGISPDRKIVPIIGGGRISGKVGSTNVGLLSMFTDALKNDKNEIAIDKNSYSVARVNHNFKGTRSSLGGVFVNRDGLGNAKNNYNRVFAIDGVYGIGKQAAISGFGAKSITPSIKDDDYAFKILGNYDWDGWTIRLGYTEQGEGFNPEVGFLQRTAFKKPEALVFYRHRVKNWGKLNEIRPHASYRSYWNFDNDIVTRFLHVDNHWVFKSGFEVHTGINFTTEHVFVPFNLLGVSVNSSRYDHEELQFVLYTNPNKAFSYRNVTFIGGYFGGNRFDMKNTFNLRIGDKFNTKAVARYTKLNLPNGNAEAFIKSARLAYSFTPKIFIQGLVQHNNISNITSVNARFGWLQTANTGLFVVLNLVRDSDTLDQLDNQIVTIKYSYQFDLL